MEEWKSSGIRTLDLGLDIVNGIRRLHLKGDSLTRKGLDENLHGGLEADVREDALIDGDTSNLDHRD